MWGTCQGTEGAKTLLDLPFPAPGLRVPQGCQAQRPREHHMHSEHINSHQHMNKTWLCTSLCSPRALPKQLLKLSSSVCLGPLMKDLRCGKMWMFQSQALGTQFFHQAQDHPEDGYRPITKGKACPSSNI